MLASYPTSSHFQLSIEARHTVSSTSYAAVPSLRQVVRLLCLTSTTACVINLTTSRHIRNIVNTCLAHIHGVDRQAHQLCIGSIHHCHIDCIAMLLTDIHVCLPAAVLGRTQTPHQESSQQAQEWRCSIRSSCCRSRGCSCQSSDTINDSRQAPCRVTCFTVQCSIISQCIRNRRTSVKPGR